MVQFKEVSPDEVDNAIASRRGRVAYPILKSFLETGMFVAELDRTGMQQSMQGLYSCLTSYIRNHTLPVKIISRNTKIYLMRLDIDRDGNSIPDWAERAFGVPLEQSGGEDIPITTEEVVRRYEIEKDKATK